MKIERETERKTERKKERKSLLVEYRRRRSVPLGPWSSLTLAILFLLVIVGVRLRRKAEVGHVRYLS